MILWAGALSTLGLYSLLYRENRFYRFWEHIFLGLATGFGVEQTWNDILLPRWWHPLWDKGEWWLIILLVPGLLYYGIYSRKFNWMARMVIGFYLGVAAGQSFQGFVNDTWPQIPASFKPIIPHAAIPALHNSQAIPALSIEQAATNVAFMVILLCVLSYFFFAFEQKNRAVQTSARLGRWMMMFSFGAIFGLTIMARLALLIDRVYFLLYEFGSLFEPAGTKNQPSWDVMGMLVALIALTLYLSWRYGEGRPGSTGS